MTIGLNQHKTRPGHDHSTSDQNQHHPKPVKGLLWWAMFIFATLALSKVFESSRLLTMGQTQVPVWLMFGFWALTLILVMMFLTYQVYKQLKSESKLAKPNRLFEALYALETQRQTATGEPSHVR